LADSLAHIREQAEGVAALDLAPLDRLIGEIGAGTRLPPAAFGWYYELGIALFDGKIAKAAEALARLAEIGPRPTEAPVVTLDDPHVTRHGGLYLRRMGREAASDAIVAPPPEMVEAFRDRLSAGFGLLDRAVPELAAEVRALVHEILLATGSGSGEEFDGASFYQLWGLLMLNPRYHKTPVAVAEVLAHESAHSLLFGFTIDEPLVFNPDAELYPSPLRRDPRPMDGIYHATFVSARMCWAMRRIAADRGLTGEERAAAEAAAARDVRNFALGDSVIAEHGRLSETGAALMDAARSYMSGPAL
jgi:HEXXH motif-containing protein